MIYFLINHDFHFDNIRPYFAESDKFSIIQVPYSLHKDYSAFSKEIHVVETPYSSRKRFWNPIRFIQAKIQANKIVFSPDDTLIFQTEADPINLLIVNNAHTQGAKVFFLEEGMGSYTSNMPQTSLPLSFKNWIKKIYLKYVLKFDFVEYSNLGGYFSLRIKDESIDAAMFYIDAEFDRAIRKFVIRNPVEKFSGLDQGLCIFLNQPIYDTHYLTFDEFMTVMPMLLEKLADQFERCIFRFHPRDSKKAIDCLTRMINRYENIVIDNNKDLDKAINEYKPLYAATLFSSGVIKLAMQGLTPLFLYPLIEKLSEHNTMRQIDSLLRALHYRPINSFERLKTVGESLRMESSLSFANVLKIYQVNVNAHD